MNSWDKTRQDDKFKKKLMTVKSTMHKLFSNSPGTTATNVTNKKANNTIINKNYSNTVNPKLKSTNRLENYNEKSNIPNGIIQDPNIYGNRVENFQRQQLLRRLLKEFGLGQYLRKFYELGYDDSNVSKLANLSIKDVDEFIERLRIFPGHRIKVLGLIDRISSLFKVNSQNSTRNNFRSSGYNTTHSNNPKRFHSTGQTRLKVTNMKQLASIYGINKNIRYNKKPKSVEPLKSKNRILNNFLNNEGFSFNYYLKDKNDMTEDEYNSIVNRGISGQTENSDNKPKAEIINEEIDKMLNFYMTKLNEKIDDSFEDSFQEEINLKNFPSVNEFMNINNEYIKDNENINNNSDNISNEKTKQNTLKNISKIDNEKMSSKFNQTKNMIQQSEIKNEILNKEKSRISENNHSKKDSTLKLEEDSTLRNYNQFNKNTEHNFEDQIYEEEFDLYDQGIPKEANDINNSHNLSKSSTVKEKCEKITKDEMKINDFHKEKISTQHNLSNLDLEDSMQEVSYSSIKSNIDKITNDNRNSENNSIKNKDSAKLDDKKEINEKKFNELNNKGTSIEKAEEGKNNSDSLDLSHIRLNKSCEVTYIRQNMDQFDIEYMCRCLGMALMKHLESSKEKSHVMELVDDKEEFSFFNSVFNKNINFLLTFFNLENQIQQISNLDKIDYYEKINSEKNQDKSSDDKNEKEEKIENIPKSISYLTHIKDPKEKGDDNPNVKGVDSMNEYDKEYVLSKIKKEDIEKEIDTIHEFFKNSAKNTKYKNVSEATKNIMTEDLNSIHEVDSIEYCKDNKLFTGEMQDKQVKNNQYINLLRESVQNLFNTGETEVNENLNIINENNNMGINEEELEDEIINYDDIDQNVNEAEIEKPNVKSNLDYDCFDSERENEVQSEKNKFSHYNVHDKKDEDNTLLNSDEEDYKKMPETPYNIDNANNIDEDIKERDEVFESGIMESNYVIDIANAEKLKNFILKTSEIYDDDYDYLTAKILQKRFVQIPDPQAIFEFAANVMILTKMEKEVIIISLIYMERFIFNTGVLINSRNWKRILFTALIVASKIWDDDSFENNHFAQVFTHLKIGEINLLERTFLELINYKVFVKCSEYFKYFFIIKSIALKYNFNGFILVPISVERMMKVQEYAYLAQKKFKKKYSCNNSAEF